MPELRIPSLKKRSFPQQFHNFILPIVILLSSFILSHPLYLKVLSFLSPLVITTFVIFLFTSYRAFRRSAGNGVGEKEEADAEVHQSCEDDEVYKIIFEAPCLEDGNGMQLEPEVPVDKFLICIEDSDWSVGKQEELQVRKEKDHVNDDNKKDGNAQKGKTSDEFFYEKGDTEEKEADKTDVKAKNGDGGTETEECASRARQNSRRLSNSLKIFEKSAEVLGEDKKMGLVLGGFGSMRRPEKDWKRTLACKLFEERRNNSEVGGIVNDEEVMDMLWESYEKSEAPDFLPEFDHGKKRGKESALKTRKNVEGDEEDDEEMNGQLCCLQAIKLSAGKVNLGMTKPNIAKISQAVRGIKWLRHGRSRKGMI